jgi:Uma2 family endonuclease
MTPLFEHENYNSNLGNFIVALAEELNIEIKSAGSMTLKKRLANRGIEPDKCFYVQNELAVRGKQKLYLETDPPPDLAIGIDITNSSVNTFEIYSTLSVSELWRCDGQDLKFYQQSEGQYIECNSSLAFPIMSAKELGFFIEPSKKLDEIDLLKLFRALVRDKIVNLSND